MTSNYIHLPAPIAGVDIETLGWAPNAAIFEIGVLKTLVVPNPNLHVTWDEDDLLELQSRGLVDYRVFKPSVTQQLAAGAVIETSTIDYHRTIRGADFEEVMWREATEEVSSVVVQLREFCNTPILFMGGSLQDSRSPEEVWVNHPSFDVPRLDWLKRTVGIRQAYWDYQKEFDVATAKLMYRKTLKRRPGAPDLTRLLPKNPRTHFAVHDCVYNLHMVGICSYNFTS